MPQSRKRVGELIDSATLQPYIDGEKPLSELEPVVAAHVASVRDWQALQAVTRPPAATFADLDPRSRAIYGAIAAALPGCTVYATGSRVKGSWRSGAADDPKTAIAQRLGKPVESDVDVIVVGSPLGADGGSWGPKGSPAAAQLIDRATFRQAVTPIAARWGVRIDRQPATTQPRILVER